MKLHTYKTHITWTGNDGTGTCRYKSYRRDHTIDAAGKPEISASSDPSFRGDPIRYNPEELFVASLSSCHMLWYLHLCSVNNVVVLEYTDSATGDMQENPDGSGQFVRVLLRPQVKIAARSNPAKAFALHAEAQKLCFLARSVNFPVEAAPEVTSEEGSP